MSLTFIFLTQRGKQILISILIGFFVGGSILILFKVYEIFSHLVSILFSINSLTIILTVCLGLTLSYLIVSRIAVTKSYGCGTDDVIGSYHYHGGFLHLRDTLSKTFAAALTIGFGGSAGLEGPSVMLGGGLSSYLAQKLNLKPEEIKVFMLAGAAAGLAAIFKAPLTGILFALEIPYKRDLVKEAFIPASIASITSYLTYTFVMGSETLFPFIPSIIIPSPLDILYTVVVGLLAAVTALGFVNFFKFMGKLRRTTKLNVLFYPLIGGVIVGVLGLLFPQILGLGYQTIQDSVTGKLLSLPIITVILILILKIVATSITLNFGGSGGLFIPSIYIGAVLGVIYVSLLNLNQGEVYIMASTAALMAASSKTLLTSVAFVAETCGPSSIIPTLIAACVSFFASGWISFYENQLMDRPEEEEEALGEVYHLFEERGVKATHIKAKDVMTPNPVTIHEGLKIKDAIKVMREHRFRKYPVVDSNQRIVGYIEIEDLLMIHMKRWSTPVNQVVIHTPLMVLGDEDLLTVIKKMVEKGEDHAYVVEDYDSYRLIGVIAGIDAIKKILEMIC